MPAIITGLVALVTALTGLLTALKQCSVSNPDATPSVAQATAGDSVDIQSVVGITHSLDRVITIGQPFTFKVTLQYSLGSADIADLHVYIEEYPQGSGCGGDVHSTNGGGTTQIRRGSGKIDTTVTWNGASPVYGDGGFLAIGVSFSDPKTQAVLKTFPIWHDCFRFSPQ